LRNLILGIGNLLLGDEGVGVHAVRHLDQTRLPPDTKVLEVGTAILDALPELEKAERVILIDAMKYNGAPGTVYRIPLSKCRSSRSIASLHGFDLSRVVALTNRKDLPKAIVFGVEPAFVGWSMELSSQVMKALPILQDALKRELQ
jgi:hydrogenase maturation protease